MKKNIVIIISCIIFIYLLFTNYLYLSDTIITSSYLFISKILPSFIPIYIVSKILINYNLPYYISKLFKSNIYTYIFIISFFIGCPSNIILINDLKNNNQISLKEANHYLSCTNFINPLFLYTIFSTLFNNLPPISIILIEILSNIIIYLKKPLKSSNIIKINPIPLIDVIINSIKDMIPTLEFIYITILLSNILILLLPNHLSNFIGLIEITSGFKYLSNININQFYKLILTIIYLSFSGLSIHMQVKYLLNTTKLKYSSFLKGRVYQTIISILIATAYYRIIS